ncbi:MAG: iron ABC transporter permease [Gammaproteobacteria bacterium]
MLTLLTFAISMLIGPTALGLGDLVTAIAGEKTEMTTMIIREIRFPRAMLGLLIGATLGLAGASLQGYLRNPLAEPGVIGVSTAAALGAVLAIYTGLSSIFPLALPIMAITGSLIAVSILQALAGSGSVLTLILAGVAISSLGGALTSLVLNLPSNPFASLEIVFWLLGSITDRSMNHVWLAGPFIVSGWVFLAMSARSLDALSLGEETAISLGVNLQRTQFFIIVGTAISVGAATAVAGVIGFIGLMVPHILRPWVGHHPSRLLLASALGGASLLLCADILVRLVTPNTELKLGVVTALIGAPFFFHLVLRTKASYNT